MMVKNETTIMPSSNQILTQINNAPSAAPDFVVFEGYTNDAYGANGTDTFNSSGTQRDVTQCCGEVTPDGTTAFNSDTLCGFKYIYMLNEYFYLTLFYHTFI